LGALEDYAEKQGQDPARLWDHIHDAARQRAKAEQRAYHGGFDFRDVLTATGSENLARSWTSEIRRIEKAAKGEVDRILFTYEKGALEQQVSRVAFFHYWQSRAMLLHGKLALENPALLA